MVVRHAVDGVRLDDAVGEEVGFATTGSGKHECAASGKADDGVLGGVKQRLGSGHGGGGI